MRKIYAMFYTFEEMHDLLQRCCFTHGEDFEIEVTDRYFWKINYYPDDSADECLSLSDYEALPNLSKIVGMPLLNTHVSHNGIWLEGLDVIPKGKTRKPHSQNR